MQSHATPSARRLLALATTTFACCAAGPTGAAVIAVPVDAGDYLLQEGNIGAEPTADISRVGTNGATQTINGRNTFLIFALPVLGAGETVTSADLTFRLTSIVSNTTTTTHRGDLWAVGTPNSTTPLLEYSETTSATDGYAGNVRIQDNILTPTTSVGAVSTSNTPTTGGDALLRDYIAAFYTANPAYAGGNYVFLRLNNDFNAGNDTRGYNVGTAASGAVTDTANNAVLTITTLVPEPLSIGLFATCAIGLLSRRRR